jgi:glyoxylase-like metal-dependent hydrolase (beta-lactamase superfamily II)
MQASKWAGAVVVASALFATGASQAQYADQMREAAPESVRSGEKPQPLQVKRIAPDVYLYWNDGSSNTTFWVTDEGVLVIDTQQHPADARRLLAEIRKVTDKPIKWVLVSHPHGDHYLGNSVFKAEGATIVAHRDTRLMMQKYYSDEVKRRADYFAKYKLDPKELQMVLPDVTFDSRFTINMGGKTAELIYLGAAQNPGDTLVYFRQSRALFLGGPFSRQNWSNYSFTPSVENWIAILRKAADTPDVDVFVGGHGDVSRRQDLLDYAQMHSDFLKVMKEGIAAGKTREQLAEEIRMPQYAHFRNYHRMRGWVFATHHLLTTGQPLAPLN